MLASPAPVEPVNAEDELRQQADALVEAQFAAEVDKQRYQMLFDLAPDGYVVTNLYGTIKMVNRAAAKMLGFRPAHQIRQPLAILIAPDQRTFFRSQLNRLRTIGSVERWETCLRPRTMPDLDVMVSVVRSFSPHAEEEELLWQLQDLTEFKRRKRDEREQYSRATFEQSTLGMAHIGSKGEWLTVNKALCEIFGYHAEELRHISCFTLVAPDDREDVIARFKQLIIGERNYVEWERRFLHKSGRIIWTRVNVTAIRTPTGKFLYMVAVIQDISERRRIEAAEHEQRQLAETLRDTALLLTSSLDFSEVTGHILQNIGRVVPHDAASLLMLRDKDAYVVRARGLGISGESLEAGLEEFHIAISESDRIEQMLRTKNPVMLPRWEDHDSWDQVPGMGKMRSLVAAPIMDQGTVVGFLKLHSRTPGFFTTEHAKLLEVFAAQASIAIQNARAFEQAQTLAVLSERHRLARELHDAVSQTLFTANMIAESLPRLWTTIPSPVCVQLNELQMLTRAALAEMRTLLLELRPEYLANIDLEAQLQQLLDALKVRKRVTASLNIQVDYPIPASVRVAFYRIAQEALNNIIKHARATEVGVTLCAQQNYVQLIVEDNGIGFDPEAKHSGFGLGTMQERAQEIGSEVEVSKLSPSGTRIRVTWGAEEED
jgi:PAS domain S-box-containing protein